MAEEDTPALDAKEVEELRRKMIEKEEVIQRLKDMFEAESYPINEDCAECDTLGKVCYSNDQGLSHRISQGTATLEDMQKASPAVAQSPSYKYSLSQLLPAANNQTEWIAKVSIYQQNALGSCLK